MMWLLVFFLLPATAPRTQELAVESRLERTETWEARIELSEPEQLRAFALAVYEKALLSRAAAGVSTPWIVAGPLAPAGLFRLMEGPFASGPAGDAHSEDSELALDSSFEGGPRSGVLAWPLPGYLGVGAFGRGEQLVAVLTAAGHPLPALRWEALGARSAPPADAAGDEWYYDYPPWPGGALSHAALRVRAQTAALGASAAAAMSVAERARQGAWALLRLYAHTSRLRGDLLLGLSDGAYRDTEGDLLRTLQHGAFRVEARPVLIPGRSREQRREQPATRSPSRRTPAAVEVALWAEGSGSRGLPPAGGSDSPGTLAGALGTVVSCRPWGAAGPALSFETSGSSRRVRDAVGPDESSVTWSALASVEARRFSGEASGASSGRLSARALWKPGPTQIGLKGYWEEGRLDEAEVELRRRGDGPDLDLALGWSSARPSHWLVSIGWRSSRRFGNDRGQP